MTRRGPTIQITASQIDRTRIDYHVGAFVTTSGQVHPLIEEMQRRGLSVHEVVDDGSSLRAVADRVIALIDVLGIEILHTSEFRSNVIALMCRKRRPVWLVSTAHGWIANDARGKVKALIDRLLLRYFDRVIIVSHALRRRLPRWWISDRKLRVLHNALVLERSCGARREPPAAAMREHGAVILLNVGRLSPEKGQALLLRALAHLAPPFEGLRLLIAGTGPLERELKEFSVALGIANRVTFLGYVMNMQNVYSHASLVVQSSLTEGLPNVVLEAACLGVPIVATDVGGTSEVIEHGVSGWLIRPRSVDELVGGIRAYLEQPARFAAMTVAAQARIASKFSFEARTAAQIGIYAEFAGDSNHMPRGR